jgi:ABC-type glutathione transport system ATPase component
VFQGSSGDLNPVMTVRRTLLDVCSANLERKSSDVRVEDERRIEAAMAAAHLSPDFLERYPHELSGGEHQRVSIARGLIPRPKLLILDEPTAALDAATKLQIVRLLANLTSRRSFAVLIVSHDVPVIRAVADRVAVMFRGRMVESGNTCDVLNHPREDYTRTLIAASTYTTLPTTPGTLAH